MTAQYLITRSMILAGIVATGETPSATELSDSLDTLNELLESMNIQELMIYTNTSTQFPVVGGKGTYTVGPTGDVMITRPTKIEQASYQIGSLEIPMDIIGTFEYNKIQLKNLLSPIPRILYYNTDYVLSSVVLYPVPSASGGFIDIYYNKPIPYVLTLSDVLVLPPGYSRLLRYNLAIELGAEFGNPVDPRIIAIAASSVDDVKVNNNVTPVRTIDRAVNGSNKPFNYMTGV